jgi:hypothetical protein
MILTSVNIISIQRTEARNCAISAEFLIGIFTGCSTFYYKLTSNCNVKKRGKRGGGGGVLSFRGRRYNGFSADDVGLSSSICCVCRIALVAEELLHSDYRTVSPYWVLPVYIELIWAVWAEDGYRPLLF